MKSIIRKQQPNRAPERADNLRRRTRLMVLFACALAMSCVLCFGYDGSDPYNAPKRMVNGQTVDLQPLFEWLVNPNGDARPLAAWKHMRGSLIAETAFGWIIEGEIEGQGEVSRFLVKNPPRQQLEKYRQLQRDLPGLERDRFYLKEYLKRPLRTTWGEYWGYYDSPVPRITYSEQQAATDRLEDLEQTISRLRQEIARTQDGRGNFRLDAFVLRLNERYDGLPVFDHGFAIVVF